LGDRNRGGLARHEFVDLGNGAVKFGAILRRQNIVLGQLDAERVDQIAVDQDFMCR
jgi:hypothetical protein